MNRSQRLLAPFSGIAGSARALGRRLSERAAAAHVSHWSDYLRETRNR